MASPRVKQALFSAAGQVQFVGSASFGKAYPLDWDSAAEALDVLSVAHVGDLVVIAITIDANGGTNWSWEGMPFTDISDRTSFTTVPTYTGYRIVQSSDTNPYLNVQPNTGISRIDWRGISVVAAVFRNVTTLVSNTIAAYPSGQPDPPAITATGTLAVITGHLDDDIVTMGAPANYILAGTATGTDGVSNSSTAIAYQIANITSINPATFTGGDDANFANTQVYK